MLLNGRGGGKGGKRKGKRGRISFTISCSTAGGNARKEGGAIFLKPLGNRERKGGVVERGEEREKEYKVATRAAIL